MNKKYYLLYVALIALLGGVVFFYFNKTKLDTVSSEILEVEVVKIKSSTISNVIEAVGTAVANESVTITAGITEYVRKIYFDDGQLVKKDQLLVLLENEEQKALLDEAKARLTEATLQYQRVANLHKKNFSAESEHDTALANLMSAKAKLNQIKAILNLREIKAPFSGVLGFRQISEGTLVEPGDEIVTLDMISPINVDFNIPERFLSQLKPKQTFRATSPAWPDETFIGTIENINARVDENTRSITVRGLIKNEQQKLRPGMFLRIMLHINPQDLFVIPESALMATGMERFVFVYDKETEKVHKEPVKIIKRDNDVVMIESNLAKDAIVVINAGFRLYPDQKVKVNYVAF